MDFFEEQEWLKKLQRDDYNAFELIYNSYHRRIYSFANKLLPSSTDVEEIVQNVFLTLWNQRKNIRITSSLIAYLYGIARHMIYQVIQQKINYDSFVAYYLENNQEYSFITEEEFLYKELENKVKRLIKELPERRRQIFLLSREEGLTYKQIALKLEISENTVDTQIRNALSFLRTHLEDEIS
jgi:RNA polymerase sigma-70 factor, ECF subfamily